MEQVYIDTARTEKEEIILNIASYCSLFALMLQMLMYAIFGGSSIIHIGVLIIAAIPTLLAFPIWLRRDINKVIIPYLTFLVVFLFQYILFVDSREFMTEYLFQFLFMCIPAYISMSLKQDYEIEKSTLIKISFLIFIMGVFYFGLVLAGRINWGNHSYNMSYSYYMLLPALVFTHKFFERLHLIDLMIMVAAVITILMLGSRGPLLCWIVYFAFNMYFSNIGIVFKFAWSIVLGMVLLAFNSIIEFLIPVLSIFGINSRSLEYFLSGELITNSGGRDIIFDTIWNLIKTNPFMGNGIGADISATGQYSHNLFLDLLLHYGIFLGGGMILLLLFIILKAYRNTEEKSIWLMFLCAGFIPAMVSGTYLTSMLLWIFIGYCRRYTSLRIKLI